jgi:ribonuclease P protein subunit RPR2
MAKAKTKSSAPVQNRPLYSRISFLQQAATYLTQASRMGQNEARNGQPCANSVGTARRLVTDLRAVSLKSRIRLSPAFKQTMCKYCDALLIEGKTCTTSVENKSKGGKKPWADMLVRRCHACSNVKRHPLNSPRQRRKAHRQSGTEPQEEQGNDDGKRLLLIAEVDLNPGVSTSAGCLATDTS